MEIAFTIVTVNKIFFSDELYWVAQSGVMLNFLIEAYEAMLKVMNAER